MAPFVGNGTKVKRPSEIKPALPDVSVITFYSRKEFFLKLCHQIVIFQNPSKLTENVQNKFNAFFMIAIAIYVNVSFDIIIKPIAIMKNALNLFWILSVNLDGF